MRKIIFLFLFLFFSKSSFSGQPYQGFSSDFASYQPEFYSQYFDLIGNSYSCFSSQTCFVLGWLTKTVTASPAIIPFQDYNDYYSISSESITYPSKCPYSDSPIITLVPFTISNRYWCDVWIDYNPICLSDFSSESISDQHFICAGTGFCASYTTSALFACDSSPSGLNAVSQETKAKTNDLLSESNSKLGAIAATNSTITNLLKQIKDALLSLNSANFGIFGTNAPSSNPSNKYNSNSPEYEPTLSSSEIDLADISSLITAKSKTCPSDISIELANSTHHLSYQPLCNFAEKLNPLVVAAARVGAAWLVIGAL